MGIAQVIVDASAILAIMLEEEDGDRLEDVLLKRVEQGLFMSPVNYFEAAVRLDNLEDPRKGAELDSLMDDFGIDVLPVTADQAKRARSAYQRFGRGNHPAKLNLGDCFAYALSKARGEPLLFKGDDFRKTDVEAAL
jgi:ribonuclease VapC